MHVHPMVCKRRALLLVLIMLISSMSIIPVNASLNIKSTTVWSGSVFLNDSYNVETGQIHEFKSRELQRLIEEIADGMGFDLTEHRLEIYGRKQGRTACRCYEIKIY